VVRMTINKQIRSKRVRRNTLSMEGGAAHRILRTNTRGKSKGAGGLKSSFFNVKEPMEPQVHPKGGGS